MSDQSQGPGWWQASDGKWYPPSASAEPPGEGWWLASDGQWYPPREEPPVPGWWLASDGRWYPPADPEPERPLLADVRSGPVAAPPPPEGSPMLLAGLPETLTVSAPPKAERNGSDRASATAQPRRERASRAGRASLGAARTPQEQIARRDHASRRDAEVVAAARSKAALGALATLRAQIEAESKGSAPQAAQPATTKPAPVTAQPVGGAATERAVDPQETQDEGATLVRSPADLPGSGAPLLELRQSAVVSDLDKLGDRLAVYEDRVSMLDRHDNVRERIDGHEIADVVLAKKLTGWTVTVESGSGSTITVKGLRQDQAEEVRSLIMGRTRRSGPVPSRGRRGAAPGTAEAPSRPAPPVPSDRAVTDITDAATPVDPVRLLAMLDELHHHHVLSTDELAEKRRVVEQLAATHQLAPTTTS